LPASYRDVLEDREISKLKYGLIITGKEKPVKGYILPKSIDVRKEYILYKRQYFLVGYYLPDKI
jgi:hypothetical protein